jgi:hypothetical protein
MSQHCHTRVKGLPPLGDSVVECVRNRIAGEDVVSPQRDAAPVADDKPTCRFAEAMSMITDEAGSKLSQSSKHESTRSPANSAGRSTLTPRNATSPTAGLKGSEALDPARYRAAGYGLSTGTSAGQGEVRAALSPMTV